MATVISKRKFNTDCKRFGFQRAIARVVKNHSISQISSLLQAVIDSQSPAFLPYDRFINTAEGFCSGDTLFRGSVESKLKYLLSLQKVFREQIRVFWEKKRQIATALLIDDLNRVDSLLEELESATGVSLWSTDCRLVLASRRGGNPETLIPGLSTKHTRFLPLLVFRMLSLKFTKGITIAEFKNVISEVIQYFDGAEGKRSTEVAPVAAALELFFLPLSEHEYRVPLNRLLSTIQSFSVIDQYCFLRKLLPVLIEDRLSVPVVESMLTEFGFENDRFISNVRLAKGMSCNLEHFGFPYEIHNAYSSGDYQSVVRNWKASELDEDWVVDSLEILGASIGRVGVGENGDETFLTKLALAASNVVTRNKEFVDSIAFLDGCSFIYSNFDWAEILSDLVRKHTQLLDPIERTSVRYSDYFRSPCNPRTIKILPRRELRLQFLFELEQRFGNGACLSVSEALYKSDLARLERLEIPNHRKLKFKAKILFNNSRNEELEVVLDELSGSGDRIASIYAKQFLAFFLLKTKQIDRLILVCSKAVAEQESNFRLLPIVEVVEQIIRFGIGNFNRNVEICNVLGVHQRFFVRDIGPELRCSFRNYLDDRGVEKPSELLETLESADVSLQYFLGRVCEVSLIYCLECWNQSEEIDDERRTVLQHLVSINSSFSDEYLSEITEISREKELRNVLAQLSRGKVHVDGDKILTALKDRVHSDFVKLKAILKNGAPLIVISFQAQSSGDLAERFHVSTKGFNLFLRLFKSIMSEFLFSNKYGLDGYLSVKIRHAVLSGRVLSIFKQSKLILVREDDSNYLAPKFWKEKLGADFEIFFGILKELNDEIYRINNWMTKEVIQIKSDWNDNSGELDFRFTTKEYIRICEGLHHEMSFQEFFGYCSGVLTERLEENLIRVRRLIRNALKNQLFQAVDHCAERAGQIDRKLGLKDVFTTIKANIPRVIEEIAEWFDMANVKQYQNFSINTALGAAIRTIRTRHPNTELSVTPEISGTIFLSGSTLEAIHDIFMLAFGNVLVHSVRTDDRCSCDLAIRLENNNFKFSFSNEIAFECAEDRVKVQEVLARIGKLCDAEHPDLVRGEGGSGLAKINKLAVVDLGSEEAAKFWLSEDQFHLEVFVPARHEAK